MPAKKLVTFIWAFLIDYGGSQRGAKKNPVNFFLNNEIRLSRKDTPHKRIFFRRVLEVHISTGAADNGTVFFVGYGVNFSTLFYACCFILNEQHIGSRCLFLRLNVYLFVQHAFLPSWIMFERHSSSLFIAVYGWKAQSWVNLSTHIVLIVRLILWFHMIFLYGIQVANLNIREAVRTKKSLAVINALKNFGESFFCWTAGSRFVLEHVSAQVRRW